MTDRRVTAAIVLKDRRVLVARRAQGQKNAGMWEFPGGKVESGESPAEALRRECREELAIDVDVHIPVADVTHSYPDLTIHLTLLKALLPQGEPTPLEHDELRWITAEQLNDYPFCPADVAFHEPIRLLMQTGHNSD